MTDSGFSELTTQPGVVQNLGTGSLRQRLIKADLLPSAEDPNPAAQHSVEKDTQFALRKNGEIIEAIMVTCSCGKTTEVLLEYDGEPRPGSPEASSDAQK